MRLDLLLTSIPRRLARVIARCADVMGLFICLVLFWFGLYVIGDSARHGSMVDKTLSFPEWWLYVPVPFCFALLAAEFVRRMFVASGIEAPASQL